MNLRTIVARASRRNPTAYAVLCTARTAQPTGVYPLGERHAILAMKRCGEDEVVPAVSGLLESYGWSDVIVDEWRELENPFLSSDRTVRACYVSAMTSDGGFVVYSDPIH